VFSVVLIVYNYKNLMMRISNHEKWHAVSNALGETLVISYSAMIIISTISRDKHLLISSSSIFCAQNRNTY
jgi:hypothetical protein